MRSPPARASLPRTGAQPTVAPVEPWSHATEPIPQLVIVHPLVALAVDRHESFQLASLHALLRVYVFVVRISVVVFRVRLDVLLLRRDVSVAMHRIRLAIAPRRVVVVCVTIAAQHTMLVIRDTFFAMLRVPIRVESGQCAVIVVQTVVHRIEVEVPLLNSSSVHNVVVYRVPIVVL